MVSLNRKHEIFWQYKNDIVSFDHYNSFKNNFTTTLHHARNNYFQRNSRSARIIQGTPGKSLNSLIRYKNTSKDAILNHDGSTVSDPSAIAEVFDNYFSNIGSNLDYNIPHPNISPLNFLSAPGEIVKLIRRQKNKSTDLMNISVFIYTILAL